ncbi:hypothetical protein IJS77_00610 [bacterium]|nr:hypothetical protein [bacterium]
MGIRVYGSEERVTGSYQQKVEELRSRAVSTRNVPSGSDGRVWTDYLDKDGKVIGRTYEFPKSTDGKNEQGWVMSNGKDYYSSDLKTISGEEEKDYTIEGLKSSSIPYLTVEERIKVLENEIKNNKESGTISKIKLDKNERELKKLKELLIKPTNNKQINFA